MESASAYQLPKSLWNPHLQLWRYEPEVEKLEGDPDLPVGYARGHPLLLQRGLDQARPPLEREQRAEESGDEGGREEELEWNGSRSDRSSCCMKVAKYKIGMHYCRPSDRPALLDQSDQDRGWHISSERLYYPLSVPLPRLIFALHEKHRRNESCTEPFTPQEGRR